MKIVDVENLLQVVNNFFNKKIEKNLKKWLKHFVFYDKNGIILLGYCINKRK